MAILNVVGMDPSMNNWGIAAGQYDTVTQRLTIKTLETISPVLQKTKQVRQNSIDIERSYQLFEGVRKYIDGAHAIFIEAPVGSQSANAMKGYGICAGLLGAVRGLGASYFELTATDVKLVTGNKNATKKDMIEWGTTVFPDAPWPKHKKAGVFVVTEGEAEHMADACAAIKAGVASQQFKQSLQLML